MTEKQKNDGAPSQRAAFPLRHSSTALAFDIDEFRQYVANADLTEAQQAALLGAIWEIVVAAVDLGFNLHPVQQVLDNETLVQDSGVVLDSMLISSITEKAVAGQMNRERN